MNPVAQILAPERILVDLEVSSREDLFAAIGDLFARQHSLGAGKIAEALLTRERLGSTGLGMGIAIPHQRIKGLKTPLGAFVRTAAPIEFAALDGQPVRLFFIMLAPEQATEGHLCLLAELAQMFSDKVLREALYVAPDAAAVFALFDDWSLHAAGERSAAV
ncbi:MAG: PTS sugar transporter subunit IIA [Candidatus Dactylopiibacterium carminicum]|uniref:PTS sugar transporter subunit IIA n=1 Tax=Candidatus Dactylopiibacterium carminicum TaxID=857335 RepID=A0A272F0B7_9RHOO|nr:PTS sugar transporter subunit IIA [Candidatus Dactylopiibacterium carminicum]KAF7600821.1 PTS sugar transporter subunit IIA [Candidatus Dactylopiibacterium carminicum]PAS95320.1 MAG: PTS sugar transporter subunit IIA [Candidatus Dactylopiibacterium carminicum]PAS98668.1 MAG: PTS sugar transporter subunit IIA [Candidatus Dactylopiibacterium carminicum]PAT00827.1 MAG: PTS sugar transporter subunit IIA [Candidatus Dactylopiibacterium carminicum]